MGIFIGNWIFAILIREKRWLGNPLMIVGALKMDYFNLIFEHFIFNKHHSFCFFLHFHQCFSVTFLLFLRHIIEILKIYQDATLHANVNINIMKHRNFGSNLLAIKWRTPNSQNALKWIKLKSAVLPRKA